MNQEALRESLSALLDDQTSELELRRVLAASKDRSVRATWSRYQVARAAMHKELLDPGLDLASAVSAALADEPADARSVSRMPWRGLGRLAVAASVTVAVLGGVRLYHQDQLAGVQLAEQARPLMSVPQQQGSAVLASYSAAAVRDQGPTQAIAREGGQWYAQRLPGYLRQHAQQASFNAPDGALPFARSVSLEDR